MNTRTSKRHHSIVSQSHSSSEDLSTDVVMHDDPVEAPPASPHQLDDNTNTAQFDLQHVDLATATVGPLLTSGSASQQTQVLLPPRSPPIGPAGVVVIAAVGVVGETDTAVEADAADEVEV
ncbi:hypothetical protein BG015_001109 [Linnemannia schmuckeri]|uniref:Uncharacterized protein n=1 Tax=Linnemannia schmuckeri TaxID=64567 RepID=A0A9P5RQP4_9FUNG|nr:hypothetical protein BG015_001109 [Linnemannia schmuckeri]